MRRGEWRSPNALFLRRANGTHLICYSVLTVKDPLLSLSLSMDRDTRGLWLLSASFLQEKLLRYKALMYTQSLTAQPCMHQHQNYSWERLCQYRVGGLTTSQIPEQSNRRLLLSIGRDQAGKGSEKGLDSNSRHDENIWKKKGQSEKGRETEGLVIKGCRQVTINKSYQGTSPLWMWCILINKFQGRELLHPWRELVVQY